MHHLSNLARATTTQRVTMTLFRATAARYMGAWSKELEPHTIAPASQIVNVAAIEEAMEATKAAATDSNRVREILNRAMDKALLKTPKGERQAIPSAEPQHEFVLGLNLEEAATLLNLDPNTQPDLMNELYNTALAIKERIYGNRIVLFAPLYLSNYCVNSCTYCAFRGRNKHIPRSMLTTDQLVQEVEALQRQGHRRLLLLTGEHPKVCNQLPAFSRPIGNRVTLLMSQMCSGMNDLTAVCFPLLVVVFSVYL